jgi:hypothetical protein
VDTVVARAMAKAPEERFRSAGDLGRAALAAAAGAELPVAERSVAAGAAAPRGVPAVTTSGATIGGDDGSALPSSRARPAGAHRRRGVVASVALVTAAAIAGLVIVLVGDGDKTGGGGDEATAGLAVIPAGNRAANPSFEDGISGWRGRNSRLARLRARDAAHGTEVVRVTSVVSAKDYGIDDAPDSVRSTTAGREYTAVAWVKATPSTDTRIVCLAVRERSADGKTVANTATASLTADADGFNPVRLTTKARTTGGTMDLYVYRAGGDVRSGESFLVDALTLGGTADIPPSAPCEF